MTINKAPTFTLTSTTTAVAYHFRASSHGGWATCTINDKTGELLIMSDWGNWAYRWNVGWNLGASRANPLRPSTLTEFLGDRSNDHLDYVACKLTSRDDRHQFDAWETVKKFKARLCAARLEQGRKNRNYQPEDLDDEERADPTIRIEERFASWCDKQRFERYHTDEPLTAGIAREIWDSMSGELESTDNEELFLERFYRISGHAWIADAPYELTVHSPSHAYQILMHGILPALRDAARAHWLATVPTPPPIGWAGDLAERQARRAERGTGGVL